MTGVFIKRETFGHRYRHTEEGMFCEGGSNWSDTSTSQGKLRIAGNHQKLGRGNEGLFPIYSLEISWPCGCWIP